MDTLETSSPSHSSAAGALHHWFDSHLRLSELYKHVDPKEVSLSDDARRLMKFNGVYTLDTAKGAFFAVDTNIHLKPESTQPIFDVSLVISLDGTRSTVVPFTGTFEDGHLLQIDAAEDGVSIDLTFHHTDRPDAGTAECRGAITLPGRAMAAARGRTYNNPIPYSVFVGEYYEGPLPVLKIGEDYALLYDLGKSDGVLLPVPSYTYNLNMYFFTLPNQVSLIMGTAAGEGLACNNIDPAATPNPRSLVTIPSPDKVPFPNIHSRELAAFSGYYQIPALGRGAFLSIQGEYNCKNGIIDRDAVWIGVSTDGVTSKSYYFDHTMSFHDNELRTPDVKVRFERSYEEETGYLVKITGHVAGHDHVTGHTYFNPVPLSDFGGVAMTNKTGDSVTVVNDREVVYNNTILTDFTYVPIMYILASPSDRPATLMSFGTAGQKGNACIVSGAGRTSTVFAIPETGD